MRRSAIALGASVLALALTAGPAVAEPGVAQTVDDTAGAAQVGAVAVNAPVRVASDGNGDATLRDRTERFQISFGVDF